MKRVIIFDKNSANQNDSKMFNQFNEVNDLSKTQNDDSFSDVLNKIVLENNENSQPNKVNLLDEANNEDLNDKIICDKDCLYNDISFINDKIFIHNHIKKLRDSFSYDKLYK